jgi:3-demethoxyubiquinol 3-hydroxylase
MQSNLDAWIHAADHGLRTLLSAPHASRPAPSAITTFDEQGQPDALEPQQRTHAAALMRVNHVGEVCAQALYMGQALATRNEKLRQHFLQAAQEETDHLAWTAQRLQELNARPSLLNPLWYAGSFGLGLLAGRLGDPVSLGFVVETERQVEAHLQSHLAGDEQGGLPAADHASRAIVTQMKAEEAEHAQQAQQQGAIELPKPAKQAMKAMAKLMTTTAHYI